MENKELLQRAIKHYGSAGQIQMVVEECSELIKEICKLYRGENNWEHIAEEVGDVEITLAQLKMIGDIDESVAEWKNKKLNRLAEMIGNENHET